VPGLHPVRLDDLYSKLIFLFFFIIDAFWRRLERRLKNQALHDYPIYALSSTLAAIMYYLSGGETILRLQGYKSNYGSFPWLRNA
jgi:hypothetical protein